MLPDYDYIEDKDDSKSSTITNVEHNYSVPGIDIYNIPEGDTIKFINQSGGIIVQQSEEESQVPGPYEIPNGLSIYEDPGVQKEKIYEWFDKKKFRKLTRAEIKYVSHEVCYYH